MVDSLYAGQTSPGSLYEVLWSVYGCNLTQGEFVVCIRANWRSTPGQFLTSKRIVDVHFSTDCVLRRVT